MQRSKFLPPLMLVLVVLLIVTGWFLWHGPEPGATPAAQGPPHHLQCANCEYEEVYSRKMEGTICTKCHTGKMKPVRGASDKKTAAALPFHRNPVALGLVGLTVALAMINLYIFVKSHLDVRARNRGEIGYLHSRCTHCKRRVRYQAKPFERKILCPTCRHEFAVPAGSVSSNA